MYTLQCRETGHMGMMFILAVSNHHYGTYDSRQAQGPGTVPCETHTHTHARTPSMYTNTQKKTHIVAQMHTNSYLLHTHTEHTHTFSRRLWLCELLCHRDRCVLALRWGSVNHTAATVPPTFSKMNGPTHMPSNNPNEAI